MNKRKTQIKESLFYYINNKEGINTIPQLIYSGNEKETSLSNLL